MGNSESQAINYTVVDRWQDVDEVLNHAVPGDLIEFNRKMGLYGHWAVYIGDEEVVNYGRKNPSTSEVQKESLRHVADGDKCRINNLTAAARSKNLTSFSQSEIVRRAMSHIGELSAYDLIDHNCEVFATECRYGQGFTCQPREKLMDFGHVFGGGAMGYEAGKQAVASGRWTEEEVADYLWDSANSMY
jgi:hypothetical protein